MVLQVLVRNYYERMGSFRGIEKTKIGPAVMEAVAKSGMTKKDFCCSMLGYSGKSPSKVMNFRASIIDKQSIDLDEANKVLGRTFQSSAEVRKFLNIPKVLKITALKDSLVEAVVKLATAFYLHDQTNVIVAGDQLILFSDWLKEQRKSSVTSVLERPEVQLCLLSFAVDETVKEPRIVYKTVVTPKPLDEKIQKMIQKTAISSVIGKEMPLKLWVRKSAEEIVIAGDKSPADYLYLLDYLNATGKTFCQEVENLGIQVPDLIEAWSSTGSPFFLVGEKVFYAYDTKDSNGHVWCKCFVEDFLAYCEEHYEENKHVVKVEGGLHELSCF